MIKRFFSTKASRVILFLLLSFLLVFLNPSGFTDGLRQQAKNIFLPFQKIFYLGSIKIRSFIDFLGSLEEIRIENKRLKQENDRLKSENVYSREILRENEILRQQLELLPLDNFELVNSFVTGQDPRGYGRWIEIDKGYDAGIREGSPVIVSQGLLVGRVEKVQKNSSLVTLITSPDYSITALVPATSTKGIARGNYGLGIILDMVLQTDEIREGEEIITAGSGSVPKGLLIGTIGKVKLSADGLFQQAEIASPVNFSKLEIVSVVKETKK